MREEQVHQLLTKTVNINFITLFALRSTLPDFPLASLAKFE